MRWRIGSGVYLRGSPDLDQSNLARHTLDPIFGGLTVVPRPTFPSPILLLLGLFVPSTVLSAHGTPPADYVERATEILSEIDASGPGAAVVVRKGDTVLFRAARGRADVELAHPLSPENVFRIGSITKIFTAATVLKLAETKRLRVDDPLSLYLPQFPNAANIRISQLLEHTAGISDDWDPGEKRNFTTDELVKFIGAAPADFPPGANWQYSNSGYILLGAVIEKVTGHPWFAATKALVTDPLGLAHTGFFDDATLVADAAEGYSRSEAGRLVHPPFASITGPAAAGALTSTADDLAAFLRAINRGRLLSPELTKEMTTAKSETSGRTVPYGYGLMLGTVRGEPVIEHNGGIEGFASQATYFPGYDVTVVVVSNTDTAPPSPRTLSRKLGALAIGSPYRRLKAVEPNHAQLSELVGRYRIDEASERIISVENGRLMARRDASPARTLQITEDGIVFFEGDGLDYFRVVRNASGAVTALDLHADGMDVTRHEVKMRP
jgi:CubicO group peptidase (beta-lactamase class C family)